MICIPHPYFLWGRGCTLIRKFFPRNLCLDPDLASSIYNSLKSASSPRNSSDFEQLCALGLFLGFLILRKNVLALMKTNNQRRKPQADFPNMHILTAELHTEGALQAAAPPGTPKGNLVISCAKWSGTKPVSATPHALPTSEAFTPEDVLLSPGIETFLAGLGSGVYSNHCGITYSPSLCVQTTSSLAKERVCFFSISLQLESNVKSSHKRKLRDSCFLEGHRAKT